MTTELKHRFDEAKDPMHTGASGGYSPELEDAIKVLEELREPKMFLAKRESSHPISTFLAYSEQQCIDAAVMTGGVEQDGVEFYVYYAPRGFIYKSKQSMVDIKQAVRGWIMEKEKRDADNPPPPRMDCTGPTARELDMQARGENA